MEKPVPQLALDVAFLRLRAEPLRTQTACQFFPETCFNVCNDAQSRFLSAFNRYGFVTQLFRKATLMWRPEGRSVTVVNILDDLSRPGTVQHLKQTRQMPCVLSAGWKRGGAAASGEQKGSRKKGGMSLARAKVFSVPFG